MNGPHACPDCLRRSWLLALLAPYIERTAIASPSSAGSPKLLQRSNEDLVAFAAPEVADQLLARVAAITEPRFEEELSEAACWATCRHDDLYPDALRDGADAPWALIGRGDAGLLAGLEPAGTVTVVGARRATSYGREVARELGRDLASAGLVVVSGLAFGIDACAHRGALDNGGRTIAVLGCGPDIAYPAAHRSLWRRIAEDGLVLSELPPGATPWRWTFPARNRIMAALAGMTVVVEAAARSGSLATAELAADLGRDLGAVPGPITSRASVGPNNLLAGGAHLVREAQDVLDAMLDGSGGEAPHVVGESEDLITLRLDAERIIGEDRVPTEELRRLVDTYGGGRDGLLDQIAQGWPEVAADIRDGVGLTTVKDRVLDTMDEDEERELLPLLDALAASEEPMS